MTKKIDLIYDSTEKCLVCHREFPIKKVRKSRIRIVKQDEDFCTYYDSTNPYFYEFLMCTHCKTVFIDSFREYLKEGDIEISKKLVELYSQMQETDHLIGERNLEDALRISKLAILTGQILKVPHGLMASILMRVAWFNRYKENKVEEEKYLQYAYEEYEKAYKKGEKIISEEMQTYLLGELSYRLEEIEKTRMWFSRLFALKGNIAIVNRGRDRWLTIREREKGLL
ncbi:DUF2225 domain-containing protein [Irregularibacter muris]|uniref:DUF2225 domain-containing protein n=1 Tax=Irregularibacter muris TaxID=1796619 RepID=A0AAE3HI45_9FIRM|nr:DUF2225 domain-containing protein [Irregularibacter muris]MCR1899859.1 DUF2225 domain-containing protein [Irregularibacter muris]